MNMRRVKQIFPAALLHLIPPMIVQVFRTENNHITLVFIFGNLKGIGPKKPGHILNRKLRPEILYGKCGKIGMRESPDTRYRQRSPVALRPVACPRFATAWIRCCKGLILTAVCLKNQQRDIELILIQGISFDKHSRLLSGKCNDPGSARELTHLNPSRL
jgi:hypothetical protein